MPDEGPLPVVVIVGRPNVGKSTLFNAITGSRRAIVGDEPGITRDRIHGVAQHRGRRFELIDTGGLIPREPDLIPSAIFQQAQVALEQAAHVIYVIDGRAEITGSDRELADLLRKLGKPVSVAVNKIDAPSRQALAHEFYSLGFSELFPISAEHRLGLDELLDHVTAGFPEAVDAEPQQGEPSVKVAIIGRPNVGKSTLLNALVGQERSIVTPIAGTTRDAVDETIVREGVRFTFVDTAGIRRKGKTRLMAEKLSVVMARRHIRMANVVLLVVDASEGVVALDATIAGYAFEAGRPIVICVNKWDISRIPSRRAFLEHVREELKFLDFAPVRFMSASQGRGVQALYGVIRSVWEAASLRIPTGELNRFVESLNLESDLKLRYITQVAVRPPQFAIFTGGGRKWHFSTERFLINRLREKFGFEGTPILLRYGKRKQEAKSGWN